MLYSFLLFLYSCNYSKISLCLSPLPLNSNPQVLHCLSSVYWALITKQKVGPIWLWAKVHSRFNHKNYNFLDCDWFKKLQFYTNSLAKLLSDSLLLDSLLSDSQANHIQSCSLKKCPLSFITWLFFFSRKL